MGFWRQAALAAVLASFASIAAVPALAAPMPGVPLGSFAGSTYDELTANKGALLKATFAKNAALCADDLVAQFFDRVPAQTAVR